MLGLQVAAVQQSSLDQAQQLDERWSVGIDHRLPTTFVRSEQALQQIPAAGEHRLEVEILGQQLDGVSIVARSGLERVVAAGRKQGLECDR